MTHKWNTSIVVALIVLVGALPASASAQGFKITKIGKGKMVSGSAQLIKTAAGTIECNKASAALEFTALEFVVLDAPKLAYSECNGLGGAVHVTTAALEFDANGSMQLEKAMTIEPENAGCELRVRTGNRGSDLLLDHQKRAAGAPPGNLEPSLQRHRR